MAHSLDQLQTLFDFTLDDLAANRAGHLSLRQRDRLLRDSLRVNIDGAAAAIALSLIPGLTIIYLWIALNFANALGPWTLALIAAWLGTMWLATNIVYWAARAILQRTAHDRDHPLLRRLGRPRDQRDRLLREGRVESIVGLLTFPSDGEHTYVRIDQHELTSNVADDMDERLWDIEPQRRYAFHLLPELLWVLSVEPLNETVNPAPIDR